MDKVELSRWMPYPPQVIYDFLTDPAHLVAVVGRIAKAKVIERNENQGRLAVVLDMPARKKVETTGEVVGVPYDELSFKTHEPFPLEFAWKFVPCEQDGIAGTEVQGALGFDLSVLGLPVAGMMVRGIVMSELKADLERLETQLAKHTA
jgi:ribosome-associated toxin RatA of RatAB toxin-antitoxin module